MAEHTVLGPVLVIGGCGFVGSHVAQHFLEARDFTPVYVASCKPETNLLDGVSYHTADITARAAVDTLLMRLRPSLVVHASTPSPTAGTRKLYQQVTVDGTRNVLEASLAAASVRALIFTSSSTMARGREHLDLSEDSPLADEDPRSHPYAATKAQADKMVLAANRPAPPSATDASDYLATACLRLPIVYGERDRLAVTGTLDALIKGQTNVQVGPGDNLWDYVSVNNAGTAHVLLARALFGVLPAAHGKQIAGEAFHINDGERQRFWNSAHIIWRAAGWKGDPKSATVVPTWMALIVAQLAEWSFWKFTAGTRRPGHLGVQEIEYCCFTHTYNISKARERLGFEPIQEFEEGLKRSVDWWIKEGKLQDRLRQAGLIR